MKARYARFVCRTACGLFVFAPAAFGQHAAGAHEHGVAELSVATDGGALVIELVSPLDNLVGFEHAPANDAQREALARAEARLNDAAGLFRLPGAAGCVAVEVSVEWPWAVAGGDGHAHDPAHDHGHDHAPGKQGADKDGAGGHADMTATYRFDCAQPGALDAIDTQLFAVFPRLHEVRAAKATARGQGATVLRAGRSVLPL